MKRDSIPLQRDLLGLALGTFLLVPAVAGAARDDVLRVQAGVARRVDSVTWDGPRRLTGLDFSTTCFEGPLRVVINPGCFQVPSGGGDCVSHAPQYFVQYFFPDVPRQHRVRGFGFISNDGATVFPKAGVVIVPADPPGLRFPTMSELANLQTQNIPTPHDTAVVFVDLTASNILFGSGSAVAVCLQFPEGGRLTSTGTGPGIAADDSIPNQDCDYFTVNGGQNWFVPDPDDPEPLDWGFELVLEPVVAVESQTWAGVKAIYRDDTPFRNPDP